MAATIDADTRRRANLRVLQRLDRNIVDLAITATHVVLYEYKKQETTTTTTTMTTTTTTTSASSNSNSSSCWEKMNVEGSLFVTKRADAPRFKLIVLNRSSTENLEVPITASFQLQVKDPYLIFRESPSSNYFRGFWFHDGNERDRIASYLEQVVKSLIQLDEMEKRQAAMTSTVTMAPQPQGDDEAAVRRDAGAALLSTLHLGAAKVDNTAAFAAAATAPVTPQQNRAMTHPSSAVATARTTPAAAAAAPSTTSMTPISSSMHAIGVGGGSSSPHPSYSTPQLVLDKKNLQLTLLSLLHDERFLDLIHAQYLKVVHRRRQSVASAGAPREEDGEGEGSAGG